jgi:molecular chaperone GrpE
MTAGPGAPWEPSKSAGRPGMGDKRPAGSAGRGPTPGSSFGSARDEDQAGYEAPTSSDAGGARVVDEDVLDAEIVDDEAGGPAAGPETPEGGGGGAGAPEGGDPGDPALQAVIKQRDEYVSALMRLQADFENYKKRIIKQQTEHLERAAEGLVEKLLPVLDTGDLALAHGGGEDVKQIMGALTSALEREGLERIDPAGGAFDPTLHDAVAHEPGDGGEQEVAEVLRAGYRWKGRVLRPAMVRVRG